MRQHLTRPKSAVHRVCRICWILAVLVGCAPALAEGPYEEPPTLEAKNLFPAEAIEGSHHAVDPQVRTDGFMTYFTIHSDFGTYQAASLEEATRRIREIQAIATLLDTSRTEVLGDAVAEGVRKPFLAARNVATRPAETVQNLGEGLGRWVERGKLSLRKARNKAEQVYDEARAAIEDEPEASEPAPPRPNLAEDEVRARALEAGQDPERAALEYRLRRDQQRQHQSLAAESDAARNRRDLEWMSEEIDKAARKYLGYDSARRDLARLLGVDPYTDNVRLQEELDKLAWAMWAGQLGLDQALPTSSVVDAVEEIDEVVWASNPKDLEVRNRQQMKDLGVEGDTRDAFYDNRLYSPSQRTRMVRQLAALEGVESRAHYFRLAASAPDWELAGYYRRSAQLLADTHPQRPLARMVLETENLLAAVSRDGDLVLPLPVDYLAWTEPVDLVLGAVERRRGEADFEGQVILLLAGDSTPMARSRIEAMGWRLETRVSGSLWDLAGAGDPSSR